MKSKVSNLFKSLFFGLLSVFLLPIFMIIMIPHEIGHYVLRKRFGVETDGIVIGSPDDGKKLFTVWKLTVYTLGSSLVGGACMPNADRSFLPKSKQSIISFAGPLMDMITASLFFWIAHGEFPSFFKAVFLIFAAMSMVSSLDNMLKVKSKFKRDGRKIFELSSKHYGLCCLTLIGLAIANVCGHIAFASM